MIKCRGLNNWNRVLGYCGQKSEASTRKMSCASLNNLAAFELAVLTNRRNEIGFWAPVWYSYNKESEGIIMV